MIIRQTDILHPIVGRQSEEYRSKAYAVFQEIADAPGVYKAIKHRDPKSDTYTFNYIKNLIAEGQLVIIVHKDNIYKVLLTNFDITASCYCDLVCDFCCHYQSDHNLCQLHQKEKDPTDPACKAFGCSNCGRTYDSFIKQPAAQSANRSNRQNGGEKSKIVIMGEYSPELIETLIKSMNTKVTIPDIDADVRLDSENCEKHKAYIRKKFGPKKE